MPSPIISNQAFVPDVGETYEVNFGTITYQGVQGQWGAQIRIEGAGTAQWIDIGTGKPLDPELAKFVVQAYRRI
jgi:hypothetical protein